MRITLKTKILASIGVVWLLSFPVIGKSGNWPQFRGWNAAGISEEKGLPVRWSDSENVRWRRELPGPGHSSPTIWGDRIFLTAYQPEEGLARLTSFLTGRPAGRLWVLALNAETGSILWQHEVPVEEVEKGHDTNSPASPSSVTDGEHVYFYVGSYGLLCYDLEGNKIWELPLGPYANKWGTASSPILYGDTVIQNVDNDEESYLLAVDKRTGRQRWRASRAGFLRGYATPMLWEINGRTELVVSGSFKVKSYDPDTGREIWTCRGLTRWVNPTPVAGHGLLFVTSSGPGGSVFLAIRPGGRGDITDTHVEWRYERGAPYVPSPIVVGDYLYAVRNGGVATCLEAKTGKVAWQERLPAGGDYYASIVSADGKLYTMSEEGIACVLEAGPTYKVLSTNDIGERCMATPAISNGQIYIRSDSALYSIGQPHN